MSNNDVYELERARARMRKKREDPEFRRREKAAVKAMRRLAREQPTRFMELLEEELR